ncbi:hypothetical protein AB0I81_23970 [Nonomuraea sp. NPDC050404]|uniref:hypothetical protein n=1 Tax=Nonomuraea sp. NPDC050404 TaxID=3155783 RepID=UPI0033EB124A
MSAPSKLRRTAVGLAVAGAMVAGGLGTGTAGATVQDDRPSGSFARGSSFLRDDDDRRSRGQRDLPNWYRALKGAGIEVEKRWPRGRDKGRWSYDSWQRQVRPGLERQRCNERAFVRLYGTRSGRIRFGSMNFIGAGQLRKTLELSDRTVLVPVGKRLRPGNLVSFTFLPEARGEIVTVRARVARDGSLAGRNRKRADFLDRDVTYKVVARYLNKCGRPIVDSLGKVRRVSFG